MNTRIKFVRTHFGLNQEQFGERIGIKQSTVTAYECGNRTPMDATIKSICNEYEVNEAWLRTGEGEPFFEKDRSAEVVAIVRKAMARNSEDDRNRMISIINGMDDAHIMLLSQILDDMFGKIDSK